MLTSQRSGQMKIPIPSPALHLGATRILAISTHYPKTFSEANEPQVIGYPPPAQILGQLVNAIFLDVMDEDSVRLENSNRFLPELPPEQRHGYRIVDFLAIRHRRISAVWPLSTSHNCRAHSASSPAVSAHARPRKPTF